MTDLATLAPFGTSVRDDLTRYLCAAPVRTVFDVGAHEGQSLAEFTSMFPAADVYSFEPVASTFDTLRRTAAALPRAHIFNIALGEAPGRRTVLCARHSCLNSLLRPDTEYAWPTSRPDHHIDVECDTLDRVASRLNVDTIDVLKLDVQGAEALVLSGAHDLLAAGRIRSVKLEVLFLALYESQPTFAELLSLMARHDFRFTGLYDPFYDGRGWLCWADALFVHATTRTGVPLPQLP
jgi:FkbM family methyltransferase